MNPTVGRIVQYYERGLEGDTPGPHAAIVTAVYSPTCVTLAVLVHHRTNVYVASSVEHRSVNPNMSIWWEWPLMAPHVAAVTGPVIVGLGSGEQEGR